MLSTEMSFYSNDVWKKFENFYFVLLIYLQNVDG